MDDVILTQRLAALERQVMLLSERLGLECPPFAGALAVSESTGAGSGVRPSGGVPDDVVELARAGKTTQAISRLRHLTGASLLEAKRIVDGL